jgi:hypothetical protein
MSFKIKLKNNREIARKVQHRPAIRSEILFIEERRQTLYFHGRR